MGTKSELKVGTFLLAYIHQGSLPPPSRPYTRGDCVWSKPSTCFASTSAPHRPQDQACLRRGRGETPPQRNCRRGKVAGSFCRFHSDASVPTTHSPPVKVCVCLLVDAELQSGAAALSVLVGLRSARQGQSNKASLWRGPVATLRKTGWLFITAAPTGSEEKPGMTSFQSQLIF